MYLLLYKPKRLAYCILHVPCRFDESSGGGHMICSFLDNVRRVSLTATYE